MAALLFVGLTASLVAAGLDLQRAGQWPGYRRGPAEGVAVSDRYACVTTPRNWDGSKMVGAGLEVIDISDPTAGARAKQLE